MNNLFLSGLLQLDSGSSFISGLQQFWSYTGFANAEIGNLIMIIIGCFFIGLAILKEYEPMLLIPIGFGIIVGNIPFTDGLQVGVYENGAVLNYLYFGVLKGFYPPLIFLGIGAMTDFSALISNPKLILIGAAAQFGIFGAYIIALLLGFTPMEARYRYHRRRRRSDRHLHLVETGAEPDGCHRHLGLLLHGFGSRNPTADYAPAH